LWRRLVESPTWIEVKFLNMAGSQGEGGRIYYDDFCGGIVVTVGPDTAKNPRELLSHFIHEMVHAFLLAGYGLKIDGKSIWDKNTDPANYREGNGYGNYPGTNSKNDINLAGQEFIDWLTRKIGAPPAFPVPRPPSEDPPIRVP
jgi:hypothetical protein